MNIGLKNTESTGQLTAYGEIGVSVFIIIAGSAYLIPSILPDTAPYFPDGTLYITAGILILLVNILNTFKGIRYDLFLIFLGSILVAVGANKAFALEVRSLPVLLIVLGCASLLSNIKRSKG